MSLKPQDIVVALKLVCAKSDEPASYNQLAHELAMSSSEVHAAVKRAIHAGLISAERVPNLAALFEFIIHGLRYAFAPERGGIVRGMPTAHAAPPLSSQIAEGELPPVWPDPNGNVRGEAIEPLYSSVPEAAQNDPALYELLALVDAVRAGRARERRAAEKHLRKRLSQ
jgi:DNA-binding Lrp family transcriptional regulator